MKIPFTINDNNSNSTLALFLKDTQRYKFYSINDLKRIKENKLIFLKKNIDEVNIKKLLNFFINENILLVLHNSFYHKKIFSGFGKIFYPMSLINLEEKFFLQKKFFYKYKNLLLKEGNFIINSLNNNNIHITETEFNIMKLLLTNNRVKKETIKKNILNLNIDIDTKSLESHLSRIRKKIKDIGLSIEIISINSLEIKIE